MQYCWTLDGFVGLPLLVLALWAGLRSWVSLRRMREWSRAAEQPLRARPFAVLLGRVETLGKEPAVSLEIEQIIESWRIVDENPPWTETSRRLEARPFELVTHSGIRVRVEPADGRIDYCDALERRTVAQDRRVLRARLEDGEQVHVSGRLEGAAAGPGGPYRGGGEGWLLRAPARGDMLISTEPLGSRERPWLLAHAGASAIAIAELMADALWLGLPGRSATCGDGVATGIAIYLALASWGMYAYLLFADRSRR